MKVPDPLTSHQRTQRICALPDQNDIAVSYSPQ
jgi:hypothetical protein